MSKGTAKDVALMIGAAGELIGKTRLQKTGVLLELTGLGFGFSYGYHLFGPFSEELIDSTDRAVALGYVHEEVKRASWGGIYSRYSASSRSSGSKSRDEIIRLARDADSIVLELAATAAFLASRGTRDAWAEVAARKPEKVTRARMSAAKELYHRLASVDVPKRLPALD
jgi:hypothetical protein